MAASGISATRTPMGGVADASDAVADGAADDVVGVSDAGIAGICVGGSSGVLREIRLLNPRPRRDLGLVALSDMGNSLSRSSRGLAMCHVAHSFARGQGES